MTPHPSFRGLGSTQRSALVALDMYDSWLHQSGWNGDPDVIEPPWMRT